MKLKFAILVFVIAVAISAIAASPQGDGKELYRSNCKTCHDKGSKHGTYTPMSMVQDQWKHFFSAKLIPSHQAVQLPDGHKALDTLTPEDLRSIQKFCVDHAADSEQPATCG